MMLLIVARCESMCVCAMCIRVLVLSPCSLPSRSFATSELLDLEATGSMSKGCQGAFTDGTYGYVAPQNNSDSRELFIHLFPLST